MTRRNRVVSMWAGIVGVLLLGTLAPASAQESGVEMWGRACGRCHRALPPNKYDADTWRAIMTNMALTARLTPQEEHAITDFLMGAARSTSEAPQGKVEGAEDSGAASGETVYRTHCEVCHGSEGKGDGPAATGITPRPTDLTQSEWVRTNSDASVVAYLSTGEGAMPGFGRILTDQELQAIVAWLRQINQAGR